MTPTILKGCPLISTDLSIGRLGRKQGVGHIVADHAHVGAASGFDIVEKSALLKVESRSNEVIRDGSSDQNVADFALAIFHAAQQTRSGYRDHEIRIRRRSDDAVDRLGVLGLDLFTVAEVPPIIHLLPRPLRDVEHIVAENGHAFVESNLDSADRGSHQRHGDNPDDDAERGEG